MNQENNGSKKDKGKKLLDSYAKYTSIAFQMLVIILLGVFGGIKLDEWLKLKFPVFTVTLAILSVMLAIYYSVKDFLRSEDKKGGNKKNKK